MKNKKFLTSLIIMLCLLCFTSNIKAGEGDAGGVSSGNGGTGGVSDSVDSQWSAWKSQVGIRVTIVDKNGIMVSERSIDYLKPESVNNFSILFYKCTNEKKHKLAYRDGEICTWKSSKNIGDYLSDIRPLDWLPQLYFNDNENPVEIIREKILNMSEEELNTTFFNELGYSIEENKKNIKDHYFIIEPVTAIRVARLGKGYSSNLDARLYYGTTTELSDVLIDGDYNTIRSYPYGRFPFSIYVSGNPNIEGGGGYNQENNTYFNGKIIAMGTPESNFNGYARPIRENGADIWKLYEEIGRNHKNYGVNLGIFWFGEFEIFEDPDPDPAICNFNNVSHFDTPTSGPNGEECCIYVKDNLDMYGITEEQLYNKYPRCRFVTGSCEVGIEQKHPTCNNNAYGYISDIDDWNCIFASSYASDADWNEYFLQYPARNDVATSDCAVYCRNEISYKYPGNNMIALAGNYFTISNGTSSFSTYIDNDNKLKVKASTLGPVQVIVRKECSISGNKNNTTCQTEITKALNNIKAPTIEFSYESEAYNNPTLILKPSIDLDNKQVDDDIHSRTVTYNYILPSTYKYVSKSTGISYKNVSLIGDSPYVTIGDHLPIHFSSSNHTVDYEIAIKKFNLAGFDKLVLNGNSVSTRFTNSIETYVKTLIDSGRAYPRNINGIYYLDNTFIGLLNKNEFTANELINSTCGNTNDYTCYLNGNGIYCYDKNTTTNSENTYVLFNACINNEAQKIKYAKENYKNDMLYACEFKVKTDIGHPDDPNIPDCSETPDGYCNFNCIDDPDCNDNNCSEIPDNYCNLNCAEDPDCTANGTINVIYRPISLDDPFPSIDADGRVTGANWCYGNDCSNMNEVVTTVITNNRGVETEELYKERDPLYTITLTPGLIKEIRKYNNKNNYDDFNLECDSNGLNCKSNFIREEFKNYFSGCGIRNKNLGLDCAENDEW